MDAILEPLLAVLAILFPLGMTYVILLLQLHEPASGRRKVSAHDDTMQEEAELSRAEEKRTAR